MRVVVKNQGGHGGNLTVQRFQPKHLRVLRHVTSFAHARRAAQRSAHGWGATFRCGMSSRGIRPTPPETKAAVKALPVRPLMMRHRLPATPAGQPGQPFGTSRRPVPLPRASLAVTTRPMEELRKFAGCHAQAGRPARPRLVGQPSRVIGLLITGHPGLLVRALLQDKDLTRRSAAIDVARVRPGRQSGPDPAQHH